MAQSYFSLVTTAGRIKLAASAAGGLPVTITHFAIGDGNGAETNPTAASTALVHEVWRTPVESVVTDPENPSAVLVTAIIPTTAGGWWMREFGIFDAAGAMMAVAKPVSQYKPTAAEGQLEDIRYEFQIIIGETANVTLLVDPSILLASRDWVMTRKIPMAQLMRLPWLPVILMTTTVPPANPVLGDTYLVPAAAAGEWTANVGKIAEWSGGSWSYVTPPDGHGISLPDGRIFERIGGSYSEKIARDVQSGKWNFAIAGGTANALTAVFLPSIISLSDGMTILLRIPPGLVITSAVTLDVGTGPVGIIRADTGELSPGDIAAGVTSHLAYDAMLNKWKLLNPAAIVRGTMLAYQTPGVHSWICPAGITKIKATVTGAGAGGGGTTSTVVGSGGGAGGTAIGYVNVTPGTGYSIIVGAGGPGGAPGNSGSPGGASSAFGLTGGGGGSGSASGDGGVASGGAINITGGDGLDGLSNTVNGGGSYWGGGRSAGAGPVPSLVWGTGGAPTVLVAGAGNAGATGIVVLEY